MYINTPGYNHGTCPSCGYCSHCGRGGNYHQPLYRGNVAQPFASGVNITGFNVPVTSSAGPMTQADLKDMLDMANLGDTK